MKLGFGLGTNGTALADIPLDEYISMLENELCRTSENATTLIKWQTSPFRLLSLGRQDGFAYVTTTSQSGLGEYLTGRWLDNIAASTTGLAPVV